MFIRIVAFTALLLPAINLQGIQEDQYDQDPDAIKIVSIVLSINDIDVSSRLKGYLESQNVKEGQFVEQGVLVSQLDVTISNNELKVAEIRLQNAKRQAEDTTALEYAKATADVAAKEYEINIGLNRRNALSNQELERSKLSKRQAELQIQRSTAQLEIDRGTVTLEEQNVVAVKELVSRHSVTAPFSGQIIKIYRRPGEWVHEGEKILRLVDLSQVKVEGHVKSKVADPDSLLGRAVSVTLPMSGGQSASFQGKIYNIGLAQKIGEVYVVQALVENQKRNDQWLLRPNAVVQMHILPDASN